MTEFAFTIQSPSDKQLGVQRNNSVSCRLHFPLMEEKPTDFKLSILTQKQASCLIDNLLDVATSLRESLNSHQDRAD